MVVTVGAKSFRHASPIASLDLTSGTEVARHGRPASVFSFFLMGLYTFLKMEEMSISD